VRWGRRIGGVLGTLALLGVGVLMGTMIAPVRDETSAVAVQAPPPAKKAAAQHTAKPRKPRLTAAQRAARSAAVAQLRTLGYLPTKLSVYDPHHELRVLVGYRNGDPLGPRRVFFFAGKRYLGTDSTLGSTRVKVAGSGRHWVRLAYGVYPPGAKRCCPSSTSSVGFRWDGGTLAPQGSLPLTRLATG
jgi:hypothetical protein